MTSFCVNVIMNFEIDFAHEVDVILSYLESEHRMSLFLAEWIPFVDIDAELRTLSCIKYMGFIYINFYRLLWCALRLDLTAERRAFKRADIQLELYYRDGIQMTTPDIRSHFVDRCVILELSDEIRRKTVCLRVSFSNKTDWPYTFELFNSMPLIYEAEW